MTLELTPDEAILLTLLANLGRHMHMHVASTSDHNMQEYLDNTHRAPEEAWDGLGEKLAALMHQLDSAKHIRIHGDAGHA